ncbi:unnamed protein product [Urochloa humidicola]
MVIGAELRAPAHHDRWGRPPHARHGRRRRPLAPAPVLPALFYYAIQLVLSVKHAFANEPGKYDEFRAILNEYKSIGTPAVLDRVRVLLRGHPDPLRRLNMLFEGRGL